MRHTVAMNFNLHSIVAAASTEKPASTRQVIYVTGNLANGTITTKQVNLNDLHPPTLETFHQKLLTLFRAENIEAIKFYSRTIDGYVDVDEYQQLENEMKLKAQFGWTTATPSLPDKSTTVNTASKLSGLPVMAAPSSTPAAGIISPIRNLLPIAVLSPQSGRDWSLRARVLMKYPLRDSKDGQHRLFNVEVIDVVGDHIDVVFWDGCADKFYPQLTPGQIYIFTGGMVKRNKLHGGLQINIDHGASVHNHHDDGTVPFASNSSPPKVAPKLPSTSFTSFGPSPGLQTAASSKPPSHIPLTSVRSSVADLLSDSCPPSSSLNTFGHGLAVKRNPTQSASEPAPKALIRTCRLCEAPVRPGKDYCMECSRCCPTEDDLTVLMGAEKPHGEKFYARGANSHPEAVLNWDRDVLQRDARKVASRLFKKKGSLTVEELEAELDALGKGAPQYHTQRIPGRHPPEAFMSRAQVVSILQTAVDAVVLRPPKHHSPEPAIP